MIVLRARLILCLCVVLPLAGCSRTRSVADEREARGATGHGDVLIGAAWPWEARKSMLYREGVDLAVEEVNQRGGLNGRRLRILAEDDHETVDEGRLVAERLAANPDVVAVIGHLHSYITNPAAVIYDAAALPLIAPASTDPELTTAGYPRVFRTIFTDRQMGREMAVLATARGSRRLAIYYIRSPYGRGLANAFEEAAAERGATILDRQSYDPNEAANDRSVNDVLDGWKTDGLNAIFIAGEAAQSAILIAEARRRGIGAPIFASDAVGTPELFDRGVGAVEGAVVATVFHARDPRSEVRRFVDAFRTRYHKDPDAAAAVGYDAVQLVARAIAEAHSAAPSAIAQTLHHASAWAGVTGTFQFDERGDLIGRTVVTMVARSGRFEFNPLASAETRTPVRAPATAGP